jgi:hypothetical protein
MESTGRKVILDVRHDLRNKLDPFQKIMDAVSSLERKDMLVLHTTFKPTPLLGVMKLKGFSHKVEQVAEAYWITVFARSAETKIELAELALSELILSEDEVISHER